MNISNSVGRGGGNVRADTLLVQRLLNDAGAGLNADGLVGPRTIDAIEQFQRGGGLVVDGRVDPGGRTLLALVAGLWGTLQAGLADLQVDAENLPPIDPAWAGPVFVDLLESLKT